MGGVTLDAGVLIAIDRGDRRAIKLIEVVRQQNRELVVPTVAFAQAWRSSRNAMLARFLRTCVIDDLTEDVARLAGELCGRAGTHDIVDAAIVASASWRGDAILTSDPRDLLHLARFASPSPHILDLTRIRLPA